MTAYALLLRGINVGGRNRLPMAVLREVAAGVGLLDPRTYLQSGNLVGMSDALAGDLAAALRAGVGDRAGLDVPVLARSRAELAAVVAANPLAEPADAARFFVSFCEEPVGDALAGFDAAAYAPEQLGVVGREIYTLLPGGMNGARLTNAALERRIGGVATGRNWRTVLALRDMTAQ